MSEPIDLLDIAENRYAKAKARHSKYMLLNSGVVSDYECAVALLELQLAERDTARVMEFAREIAE